MTRTLAVSLSGGSDPDVIEIDDAQRAVGADLETDDFGEVIDRCQLSGSGQHEYSIIDNFARCVHCGEAGRLWD